MATVTVLTATKILAMLGDTIVNASISGDNLILTTRSGVVINAGSVRGPSATAPTAAQVGFSPTAGIVATNVQAALAELAGDGTTLTNNKANVSEIPKILSGRVTQPSNANVLTVKAHSNIFPSGYFATAPEVLIIPNTTVPQNIGYYSVSAINTRGFTLSHMRTTSSDTIYNWIAM